MDRLQKKCAAASAGMHGLLILALLAGSAFFVPRPSSKPGDQIGAGNAAPIQVFTLAPAPESGADIPSSASTAQPVPPVREVREARPLLPDRDALESNGSKPSLPRISTNLVLRPSGSGAAANRPSPDRLNAAQFEQAGNVLKALASGGVVGLELGPGQGDGSPGYAQSVKEVYARSWDQVAGSSASTTGTTGVKVAIASSGKVISAEIILPSGDEVLDKSVQRTLSEVKWIKPFEAGARESQRTYTINFNLQALRLSR